MKNLITTHCKLFCTWHTSFQKRSYIFFALFSLYRTKTVSRVLSFRWHWFCIDKNFNWMFRFFVFCFNMCFFPSFLNVFNSIFLIRRKQMVTIKQSTNVFAHKQCQSWEFNHFPSVCSLNSRCLCVHSIILNNSIGAERSSSFNFLSCFFAISAHMCPHLLQFCDLIQHCISIRPIRFNLIIIIAEKTGCHTFFDTISIIRLMEFRNVYDVMVN